MPFEHFKPVAWQAGEKNQLPKSNDESQPTLADKFIESNQNAISEINAALFAGDMKLAYRTVHNLKSNAGFIGKPYLQQAAEIVETRIKDGKNLIASSQLAILEQELKTVLAEMIKLKEKG